MKKFILLLMIAFATLVSANAQVYLGGSFTLAHNKDIGGTIFSIAPEVGYNLNEKWAIATEIGYTSIADVHQLNIAPYARFSYLERGIMRLFVDGGVGVSTGSGNTGFEIGFKPGIAIKACEHISFIAKFGYLGLRDSYLGNSTSGLSLSSEDLSIGFHYEF